MQPFEWSLPEVASRTLQAGSSKPEVSSRMKHPGWEKLEAASRMKHPGWGNSELATGVNQTPPWEALLIYIEGRADQESD